MKYRLQRVDLQEFLQFEIPWGQLNPDLRQRVRHALSSGGELSDVGAAAVRELLSKRVLQRAGNLRQGEESVPVFALQGSSKVFDLRTLLCFSPPSETAAVEAPEPRASEAQASASNESSSEENSGLDVETGSRSAPIVPTGSKSRANSVPPPEHRPVDGQAWVSLGAIRSTLRRDWVSYGLEASLEDLLSEIRERLHDPDLRCVLWPDRLGTPVSEGQGWDVASESDAELNALLPGLPRSQDAGFLRAGRRWFGVWARDNIVAALGCTADTQAELAVEAAAAIGDLVLAALRSQRRVYTDPLTGVNNRSFFDRQLPVELERSRRASVPLALLFADLDLFKQVNDRHGHEAGDAVLRHVAGLLQSHLRRIDYVFRWGGEEFAMLLPGTDVDEALQTAERLRRTVETTPVRLADGAPLPVTVSIGAALFPLHARGERELLRHADQALYRAKDGGRNRVEIWQPNKVGG